MFRLGMQVVVILMIIVGAIIFFTKKKYRTNRLATYSKTPLEELASSIRASSSKEPTPQCNICGAHVVLSGFSAHLETHKDKEEEKAKKRRAHEENLQWKYAEYFRQEAAKKERRRKEQQEREKHLQRYQEDRRSRYSDSPRRIMFIYPVSKDSVLKKSVSEVDGLVRAVTDDVRKRGSFEPWNLTISDYETDRRELFEIPEVRTWCGKVHAQYPFLPLLLTERSLTWYIPCLMKINIVRKGGHETLMKIDENEAKCFFSEACLGAVKFFGIEKNFSEGKALPQYLAEGLSRLKQYLQ